MIKPLDDFNNQVQLHVYGMGVFETMLVKYADILDLKRHLTRLNSSLKSLGVMGEITEDLIDLHRDYTKRDLSVLKCVVYIYGHDGYYSFIHQPYRYSFDALTAPVKISLANRIIDSRNPLIYHKTTNYWQHICTIKRAQDKGLFDLIYENEHGHMTEGAKSNIFIIKDDIWLTPPVKNGLLCGIAREFFIRALTSLDVCVKEQSIHKNEWHKNIECVATNSLVGGMGMNLSIQNQKILRQINKLYFSR